MRGARGHIGVHFFPHRPSHAFRHPSRYLPTDILPVVVVPLDEGKIGMPSELRYRPHIAARQLQRLGDATVSQPVWPSHDPHIRAEPGDDPVQ